MQMNVCVQIPPELLIEAVKELNKANCIRKQPVFDLFPEGVWRVSYVCGRNKGKYWNGYGVGHTCSDDCKLRVKIK